MLCFVVFEQPLWDLATKHNLSIHTGNFRCCPLLNNALYLPNSFLFFLTIYALQSSEKKMAPITTYFLMLISSVFYVFSDARLALEELTAQHHLLFPYSSLSFTVNHHEYPILLWIILRLSLLTFSPFLTSATLLFYKFVWLEEK